MSDTVAKALDKQQFISLTTFRKSGVAVPTPVWFAWTGDRMYITTLATAGKAKRLRNQSKVTFAPCTASGKVTGPTFEGTGRVLPAEEFAKANAALSKKYGLQKRLFELFMRGERVYLEVMPTQP